jgi:glycosyltransferase involved in cell wall biosynthesis
MKICIVSLNVIPYFSRSSGSQFGGAEVQSAVLAKAFSAAGADVNLVVANLEDGVDPPYPAYNAYFSRDGLPGVRFLYPRMTGLLNALERVDADVYFQHCAGWVTGITAWFCKRNNRKFVYFAGSDSDFSHRDVIIENARDKLLYFWGVKNAAGVVVQNEYQAGLCRVRFKREPKVIPTAVGAAVEGDSERDGSVVWAGGLRAVKRPDLFLELARRLPDRQFVLLGGELPTEREYGRRILLEAGQVQNLQATGFVSADEVAFYLSRAALLVNTSSFEGFPNAFLEAWTRKTPVVSFVDVDGIIEKHRIGRICADIDEMARYVGEIAGNEDLHREMGERARQLVDTKYSASVTARLHMDFFKELKTR